MQIEVSKRLNGIGEYYFSQKLREIGEMTRTGEAVINLGIGSPDMPPADSVITSLQTQSSKPCVHGYQSYKGSVELRQGISSWYQQWYGVTLDPDSEILPLIGSKEGIMHISMTYLNAGDKVLIPDPGYPTYKSASMLAGADCINYELTEKNNWEPDLEDLEQKDLSRVKIMWVNYPHMPTGQSGSKVLFERLIAFGRKHSILICHDNPYSFILNEDPISILSVDGAKEVAVELNSLSKSHNMAGWRIGMLCGAQQRIDEVLRFKSNMDSGMFLPVQSAAASALSLGEDWFRSLNKVYAARREKVYELLDVLKCTYSETQVGLFVWAAIPTSYKDGYQLSDEVLHSSRVFLTPGGIFGKQGENYIRISLCTGTEKILEATKKIRDNFSKHQ
jgi:LL-diaminopimelate aminotransferase